MFRLLLVRAVPVELAVVGLGLAIIVPTSQLQERK
jgi:hypothetical protein